MHVWEFRENKGGFEELRCFSKERSKPDWKDEQGAWGAEAHKHSGVKQQVAQRGHSRESQRRGQQGSEAWLERQGTDRARKKLQKWTHPGFKQGVGCSLAALGKMPMLEKRLWGLVHRVGQEE